MENSEIRVFVTGGTGLVGSHLLFKLLESGFSVKVAVRNSSNTAEIRKVFAFYSDKADVLFRKIEFITCKLEDSNELEKILQGIDHVFHCAASVSFNTLKSTEIIENNVLITRAIVEASLRSAIKKLCHVSSVAALSPPAGSDIITELDYNETAQNKQAYAKSKYLSEEEVWKGIKKGLNAVIVNPSVILGPGNWKNGSSQYFSVINRGMPFYTTGITGYVDVRDVVSAMLILMNSDISGKRFIISSENLSFREVFSMIAVSLKKRKPFIRVSERIADSGIAIISFLYSLAGRKAPFSKASIGAAFRKQYYSNSKIIKETGFSFIPVAKTISDTAEIFLRERANQ